MNKRLKKFITAMKKRGFKHLCGDKDSVIITFAKFFGDDKYLEFIIRIDVDTLHVHNVYAIDNFINKNSIDHIENKIEECRKESEEK